MVLERASDLGFTAWESSDLEGPAHESESLEVNMKLKSKTRENRGPLPKEGVFRHSGGFPSWSSAQRV